FHFVSALQYAHGIIFLELVIVFVRAGAELNLFDCNQCLFFLGVMSFLLLLIDPLPIVHNSADWRCRLRRYLDQIEPASLGHTKGILRGHNTELCSLFIDHAYLRGANSLVNSNLRALRCPPSGTFST